MNRLKLSILSVLITFSLGVVAFNQTQEIVGVKAYTNNDVATYYNDIGQYSKGNDLTVELNSLNNTKRRRLIAYDNLPSYFTQTDPGSSSGQVTAFYSGTSARYSGNMNKEHVWPFSKLYINTGSRGQNDIEKDLHMIRPTMSDENEGRGNSFFTMPDGDGWDPGSLGNESYRGDSARIIFYCCIADLNLTLVDRDYDSKDNHTMGKLSTLLAWNIKYPVQQRENVRNEAAESIQGHRNPFIDHPEYACRIWGDTNSNTRNACRAYGTAGKLDVKDNSAASTSFKLEIDEVLNLTASVGNSTSGAFTFAISNENGVVTTSDKISIQSSNNSVAITGLSKGKAYLKATATNTLPDGTTENLWDVIEIDVTDKLTATSLYVDSFPIKTDYYVGDTFNPAGLRVMVVYSDGTREDVTNQITFGDTSLNQAGVKTIEMFYTFKGETLRTSFSVIVRENSAPPTNSGGGCGGNISSTSFLLSSFALIGVFSLVLTLKKRKK